MQSFGQSEIVCRSFAPDTTVGAAADAISCDSQIPIVLWQGGRPIDRSVMLRYVSADLVYVERGRMIETVYNGDNRIEVMVSARDTIGSLRGRFSIEYALEESSLRFFINDNEPVLDSWAFGREWNGVLTVRGATQMVQLMG
jgi:hypothetical protein